MNENLCVIVGAGAGVSLAVARIFAHHGFAIALMARRAESLEIYVADLNNAGIKAYGFVADAANPDSVIQAFNQLKTEVGLPSVLVYNAASFTQALPSELNIWSLD